MFKNKRNIYKDPQLNGKIILKNGGSIVTQDGVTIIDVDNNGNAEIIGDIQASAGSIGTTELADNAVTLAKLASGVAPAYITAYAGKYTWSGSGASAEETVTGALDTDIVIGSIQNAPTEAGYIASIVASTDAITTTLSTANTSDDAVIAYQVLRAVS